MQPVVIYPVTGLGEIRSGDDLGELLLAALDNAGLVLQAGDILVVTSKIVSKAEGRRADLRDVTPGA